MLGEAAYHISESQLKHEAPSLRAPCPSLADSERRLREACSCTAQPAGSRACEGWLERRLGQSAANIGPPGPHLQATSVARQVKESRVGYESSGSRRA